MATKSIRKTLCIVVFAVPLLLMGTMRSSLAKNTEEGSIGPTKTAEVTIQKKTRGGFLTKELRLVRISRHTEYTDKKGKKVDFESFAAPCRAVIVYEPEPKGDPVAVSVTVKELLPGATSLLSQSPE